MVDQRVEEHVDAFERGRGAAEHGGDGAVVDAVVDALEDFVAGELFAREELLEQLLVRLGDRLADGGGQALEAVLDVGHRDLGGLALGVVLVGLVVDQVDVALDLVVLDDRHDERADRRPERALELLEHLVEVGVLGVHLVDEEHPRFAHLLGQLIRLFRAHVEAGTRRHGDQHALRRAHAFIHARSEIEKSRGVDQVDLDAAPAERSDRARNGNLAFDLLGVEVADGVAVGNLSQSIGCAGLKEQGLRQGGFAAASVAGNCNVPDLTR